ncbi:hypothetical protein CVT24_003703 [Panaeolus cyanescens]|uniref:F-box domain-containing protein n=1 Tax=Panaeolus cyanescens TaxID=181874 RepID=A0A409YXR4_9AGAR|nr:hypothetical protein CVT24_003703 [Panaeolus cyanescens]
MHIVNLPPELVEEILVICDPVDVAQVAQTCTTFRSLIYQSKDSNLWRTLYLSQPLDDPRKCVSQDGQPKPQPIMWRTELQRFVRARTVMDNPALLRKGELEEILQTLMALVCYVPAWITPSNSVDDDDEKGISEVSDNLMLVAALLGHDGFLDTLEVLPNQTFAEKMLLARLHCYYGLTKNDVTNAAHAKSRAYVYNMRHYRPESDYGPFMPNGTVNWVHMQAIHHVVSMHVVDLRENQDFMFAIFPMTLPFTQIVLPENADAEEDWAGVNGKWQVAFCFCDHRELMGTLQEDLDETLFQNPDFREVFRWLDVRLSVTKTEYDPKHPTKPIIHFFGEMQEPSSSTMTGKVKMTPDNQVQWHFVSGDSGNAIWSSEGIQVGGLRSFFGILGSWTTVFHEDDDPVGPFWMRRLRDEKKPVQH